MKQTSVEWLIKQLSLNGSGAIKTFGDLFGQTREMNKKEMMDFANWCRIHDNKYKNEVWSIQQLFEKYYNETYGKQNHSFISSNKTSSDTICEICGKEKFLH